MARKSRKISTDPLRVQVAIEAEMLPMKRMATAAYARLSTVNNGNDTESIENQVMLLHQYIHQNEELELMDTYIDNGYTGTNFERPDFIRLMDDVKAGRITCIVVKDLSRFGRDYIETGYYIESIFPRLGVRFIAVADSFDSSDKESQDALIIPIKNMVNSLYAKDISKKITSINEVKQKRGEITGGFPPYGYRYGDDNKHYEVDHEVAPFVRMIFQWLLLGANTTEIARRLELLKAPSPLRRRIELSDCKGTDKSLKWMNTTVYKLIMNPVYVGDMVLGKTRQAYYKGIGKTTMNSENWYITKGAHEALVARDDYEVLMSRIKDTKANRKKALELSSKVREKFKDCFPSKIYCGECGNIMRMLRFPHDYITNEIEYTQYSCSSKLKVHPCATNQIKGNLLKMLVMDQVQLLVKNVCDREKTLIKIQLEHNRTLNSFEKLKSSLSVRNEIQQIEEKKVLLYENYATGIIDYEEFQNLKDHYKKEKEQLDSQLAEVENIERRSTQRQRSYSEFANHFEKYLDSREFNETLVKELIDRIEVYLDGSISVKFKCSDLYNETIGIMEGEKYGDNCILS